MPLLSEEKLIQVCRVGCRSWWCSRCARRKGWVLINKLLAVVAGWSDVMMITLTFDHAHFGTPEKAWRHGKTRISRLMQELKRRGFVTGDYFGVLETHSDAEGWPHFHILCDSRFIPHDVLSAAWNNLGPGKRMGHVWVTRRKRGMTREHAAWYACKYLIKPPATGWPAWVLTQVGPVRRYYVSKGLFGGEGSDAVEPNEEESASAEREAMTRLRLPSGLKQEERVAMCGGSTVVLEVTRYIMQDGEIIDHKRFHAKVAMPVDDVLLAAGFVDDREQNTSVFEIDAGRVSAGLFEWLSRKPVGRAVAPSSPALPAGLLFDRGAEAYQ